MFSNSIAERREQGNEALDAVPQRARRDLEVEHRQLSRYRSQRTVQGVSLGQKPVPDAQAVRRVREQPRGRRHLLLRRARACRAVPGPAATPLVGANLDLDELGDLFSVSRVRLAAVRAAAFLRFNDLYLYRQILARRASVRRRPGLSPPTPPGLSFRAVLPRTSGALALATELVLNKLAVARRGRSRVRSRRVASPTSQDRAEGGPFPAQARSSRRPTSGASARCATPPPRARPCCAFQNVAC